MARGPGAIETIEHVLDLPDGLLALLACVLPGGLGGDAVEADEGLEEELAEAEVLLAVGGVGEEGGEGGGEGGADLGELCLDGVDDGLLCALGRGGGGIGDVGGADEGDGGGGVEVVGGDWGVVSRARRGRGRGQTGCSVVFHDGAGVDELEGMLGEMRVLCEGLADGRERGVGRGELKGDSAVYSVYLV